MIPTDEIISMAREAGFRHSDFQGVHVKHSRGYWVGVDDKLASFAVIVEQHVRADEREACPVALLGASDAGSVQPSWLVDASRG